MKLLTTDPTGTFSLNEDAVKATSVGARFVSTVIVALPFTVPEVARIVELPPSGAGVNRPLVSIVPLPANTLQLKFGEFAMSTPN